MKRPKAPTPVIAGMLVKVQEHDSICWLAHEPGLRCVLTHLRDVHQVVVNKIFLNLKRYLYSLPQAPEGM